MKLKLNRVYSQRDQAWSSEFLGYNTSTYTLGLYGCLITSLATYLTATGNEKTPHDVNGILKASNGFVSGGNFVWSKCSALGLSETYVSPSYTGPVTDQGIAKIKTLLDGGYPLLCEVDFNPATDGEEMHFVLLCGYDGDKIIAADPWTGTVIDLDVYGGPKRAIIKFRAYDKRLALDDGIQAISPEYVKQLEADRLQFWKERDGARNALQDTVVALEAEKAKSEHLDTFLGQLAQILSVPKEQSEIMKAIQECVANPDEIRRLNQQIVELKTQNAELTKSNAEKEQRTERLDTELTDTKNVLGHQTTAYNDLEKKYEEQLKLNQQPDWEINLLIGKIRFYGR